MCNHSRSNYVLSMVFIYTCRVNQALLEIKAELDPREKW